MKTPKFEMKVLVGGQPLTEYKSESGEVFIEASFKTSATYFGKPETESDPHGETYDQAWYVCVCGPLCGRLQGKQNFDARTPLLTLAGR